MTELGWSIPVEVEEPGCLSAGGLPLDWGAEVDFSKLGATGLSCDVMLPMGSPVWDCSSGFEILSGALPTEVEI